MLIPLEKNKGQPRRDASRRGFTVSELLKATRGRLISGGVDFRVSGISIDSRAIKKDEAFLAIKGDHFDGHDFIEQVIKKGVKCVVARQARKIRGVALIKVKDTTRALGDIARFNRLRFKDIPVIAVTGSNGKTTAKEMIASVLALKFKVLKNEGTKNNHIGLPLALLKLDNSCDLAVLEIGTNHFGEVKYLSGIARPNIGAITNIGPSHLEYFKNLRGVSREKLSLFDNLARPAIAIVNADDKFLRREALKKTKNIFTLGAGIKNKSDFTASGITSISGRQSFTINKRFRFALKALGYYNIYNSLLAAAVGRIFGLGYRDISSCLSGFNLPKGRLNLIEIKGVRFIDDTYNANPLSMRQALGVLRDFPSRGRKILVMGDMLELGAKSLSLHSRLIKEALKFIDILITVGELTRSSLKGKFSRDKIFTCQTSSEAREALFKKIGLNPEDIILVKGSRGMKMEEVFKI